MIAVVKIVGANKTKVSFLKTLLSAKKKATFLDYTNINNDIIFLKRIPAISHAYYKIDALEKNEVAVSIIIEENFTLIPDINF
jgi:hypothetical protein